MKIYFENNEPIPDYSLSYLINGDDSGLTPDDKIIIDQWLNQYQEIANKVNGDVVIACPNEDQPDPYFTWNPAFGLACNCFDLDIVIMISDDCSFHPDWEAFQHDYL